MTGKQVEERLPAIDEALVRRLLLAQFPEWAGLPISSLVPGGWDNRSFRLGDHMVVRLPSAAEYAPQVEKEHRWLPLLKRHLPLRIPTPVAIGVPGDDYPWHWSINGWIEGEPISEGFAGNLDTLASDLASLLVALHRTDLTGGPEPGAHNFHRGGSLAVYDSEVRHAVAALSSAIDARAATEQWEHALDSTWQSSPVWIHGDMAAANLLAREGRLNAVLDFGLMAIGDPACDLVIAWTLFEGRSRDVFRGSLPLDPETWSRARGWALWKALIVSAGVASNAADAARSRRTLERLLGAAK
jgi:aminoglycoside phosphotransferase (APT) family kinase protein